MGPGGKDHAAGFQVQAGTGDEDAIGLPLNPLGACPQDLRRLADMGG